MVFDNLVNSQSEALKRVESISGKTLEFIEGDVCDHQALRQVFSGYDIEAVVHFAGLKAVGESTELPSFTLDTSEQAEDWVTSMLWQRLHQKLTEAFHSITLEDLYYDARSWQAAQGEGASFVV